MVRAKDKIHSLTITLPMTFAQAGTILKAASNHHSAGIDRLIITCREPCTITIPVNDFTGEAPHGWELRLPTTFTLGPEPGRIRCYIAGELLTIDHPPMRGTKWRKNEREIQKRNAELIAMGHNLEVPPDETA